MPNQVKVAQKGSNVSAENTYLLFVFNLNDGKGTLKDKVHGTLLSQAYSELYINDLRVRTSDVYKRTWTTGDIQDEIGSGKQLTFEHTGQEGEPNLSLNVKIYDEKPAVTLQQKIANTTSKKFRVGDIFPLVANLSTGRNVKKCKVYINSGSQGFSGVKEIGEGAFRSAYLSVVYSPEEKTSLGIGSISYQHAETTVSVEYASKGSLRLKAMAHYNGYEVLAGEQLSSETFLLDFTSNPLQVLENYGDTVVKVKKPRFSTNREGMWNLWYAYWNPRSEIGEARILESAQYLATSPFKMYGVTYVSSGVWQNRAAFGEDRPWLERFPHGLEWLTKKVREYGVKLMTGGFFAHVTESTPIYHEHPELLVKDESGKPIKRSDQSWGACPYPYFDLDATSPRAEAWLKKVWRRLACGGATDYFWLDFEGTGLGEYHNKKLVKPFETDRQRIGTIKKTLGKEVMVGTYTSPTNRYIGIVDRVRLASDIGWLKEDRETGWSQLKSVARNMAAGYFYNNRFWLNDPDPPIAATILRGEKTEEMRLEISGDPSYLDEARVRVMIAALSGGFITIGEDLPNMPPDRLRLLTTCLPPYGETARPIDLFENEVPEAWDLKVETAWEKWHILGLINWKDEERKIIIDLKELGLSLGKKYFTYEFWSQEFLGEFDEKIMVDIDQRSSKLLLIKEKTDSPWLLSTDMHVTQGGVEVPEVGWDASTLVLSGKCRRAVGAKGKLVIYVPDGYSVIGVDTGGNFSWSMRGKHILELGLNFSLQEIGWRVKFKKD